MLNMPARCINADAHLLRACVYIFGWFADVCALVFSKILIVTLFSAMSLSLKFHFHCGIIWKIELYFLLASTVSSSAAELFPWDYRYLWQYDGTNSFSSKIVLDLTTYILWLRLSGVWPWRPKSCYSCYSMYIL